MRDHKDITNYATLPTMMLPASLIGQPLCRSECLAHAEYYERRSRCWFEATERRRDLKEARGWRKLAAERDDRDVPAVWLDYMRDTGLIPTDRV